MSFDSQITSVVNLDSPPVTVVGFTTAVVAGAPLGTFTERIRFYSDTDEAADDADLTSALQAAVNAAFSQDGVGRVGVARLEADVAQVYTVRVTAADDGTYTVTINGTDFDFAASSNTATEIRDGLVTAINGGAEPVTAAPVGTDELSLTADVSGDAFTATVAAPVSGNLVFLATVTIDTATGGETYAIELNGEEYIYTADGGDATTDIATALAAAIDASSVFSAAAVSSDVEVTATTAFNTVLTQSASLMTLADQTPNRNVSTELDEVVAENNDWYGLHLESRDATDILRAASWTEGRPQKVHVPQSSDSDVSTSSTTDIASQLAALSYERTALMYYTDDSTWAAFSWLADRLAADPDETTTIWSFVTLAGVTTEELGTTKQSNVLGKNANVYSTFLDIGSTGLGTLANGQKIDLRVTADWAARRIKERLAQVLLNASNAKTKIPYTNGGITIFGREVDAQLSEGDRLGHFVQPADDTERVNLPDANELDAQTKASRILSFTWQAEPAGAIEGANITGFVTLTL